MKYYIYKITNILNSKVYIGQTKQPKIRWKDHIYLVKRSSKQYIHRAMKKYGVENFIFEVIAEYKSQDEINLAEDQYIEQFQSRNKEFGYNMRPGVSQRVIARIRKTHKIS